VPRVSPIRSALEWLGAAAILVGVLWLASDRIRDWAGPRLAPPGEAEPGGPPDIPAGATEVPLLVLLDGTEIKVGDTHAHLNKILDEEHATGPPQTIQNELGERLIRSYRHGATRFIVVCERSTSSEPLKVAAIYLP
jgi:hypothetical protein